MDVRSVEYVKDHNRIARRSGTAATLTFVEWRRTMAHFAGLCAYCEAAPVQEMDHFVPRSRGGGTTPGNCLPACARCNLRKNDLMPAHLPALFGADTIARLIAYLRSRSDGPDVDPRPARARAPRGRKPGWGQGLKRRVLLLVTDEKYAAMTAAALASGKNVNAWVREAVEIHLNGKHAPS